MSSQATDSQQPDATGLVSVAAARGPLALSADGLGKDFRLGRGHVLHAVRDVSIGLYRSAVVALVGESGSGKSTVARLLAGQEQPTAGTIMLDDQAVHLSGRRAFRQYKSEVQLVFQDPFASLNPAHTVRYHIERPLHLHRGALSRQQVREQAAALLEQVRLSPAEQVPGQVPARAVRRAAAARRVRPGARRGAARAARRRAGLDARRVDPARDARACSTTCARGSSWRCSTSPTTSPRRGTSPTRCWSCTPGRSSSAARPRT